MTGAFEPLLILLGIIALPVSGLSLARVVTDGKWHNRHRHKCGYHQITLGRIRDTDVCPNCGQKNPVWEHFIARAKWPLGWEELPHD